MTRTLMDKTSCLVYGTIALFLSACQIAAPRGTATLDHIDSTLRMRLREAKRRRRWRHRRRWRPLCCHRLKVDVAGMGGSAVEQRFDITVTHASAREFFMSLVEARLTTWWCILRSPAISH